MMITQLSDYHLLVVITHAMQSLQSYNPCNPTGAINKELALDYKMLKNPNNRKYDNVNDALSIGQGN